MIKAIFWKLPLKLRKDIHAICIFFGVLIFAYSAYSHVLVSLALRARKEKINIHQ